MRFRTIALALVVIVVAVRDGSSEERRLVPVDEASLDKPSSADEPMPIFNQQVRRFRFKLDETLVTVDTAEQFMLLHRARNEPAILGAFPDFDSNSLVVVGPPGSEHAIRETLAKWMVDRGGVSPPPLKAQKRRLEFRRKELLREMAVLAVQGIAEEGSKAEKIEALLQVLEDELSVVGQQIAVVERYVQRLRADRVTVPGHDRVRALGPADAK